MNKTVIYTSAFVALAAAFSGPVMAASANDVFLKKALENQGRVEGEPAAYASVGLVDQDKNYSYANSLSDSGSIPVVRKGSEPLADSTGRSSGAREGWYYQPYLGAEVQFQNHDIPSGRAAEDSYIGGAAFAGLRLHRNMGVEVSYSGTLKEDANGANAGSAESSFSNIAFDVMGYVPVTEDERLELVGSVGVGRQKIKGSGAFADGTSVDDSSSETGLRLGAGMQYHLTDHTSMRGMVRWQDADDVDMISGALGLVYGF